MMPAGEIAERLRAYFARQGSVLHAFLFGSHAAGRAMAESDLDIGLILTDRADEQRLWGEVSEICGTDVDLVVLNDAPATLVSAVLKTGVMLAMRDRGMYLDLLLAATGEAEDFSRFASDCAMIAARSRSLAPEDRTRLARRLVFLREEIAELPTFAGVSFQEYRDSRSRRREMERWAENVANATIDIAKIALASTRSAVPQSYREALGDLGRIGGLSAADIATLEGMARLRNLLAHEYLDLLYERIRFLVDEMPGVYDRLLPHVDRMLAAPTDVP